MPLSVLKRNNKEYLYFVGGASKKIYLGTSDNPRKERIEEAIQFMRNRIEQCADELRKLESLLRIGIQEPEGGHSLYYKLVVFDLDGVIYQKPWYEISDEMVAVSTWDVLFQEIGMYPIHEKLKQNFKDGIFQDYLAWTEAACNVLKSYGLDKKKFENVINKRPLTQGVKELFHELHRGNIVTGISTGSFEALAQRANRELGRIDHVLAHCKLIFNSRGLLDAWKLVQIDYEDKANFIKDVAKRHNIPLEKCAYVGDDVNDIEAFKKVGLAIAFNCRKYKVQQFADVVIDSQDLRAVLPHLMVVREKSKIVTPI